MRFAPVEGISSKMGRHRNSPDKKWIALVALRIACVLWPAVLQAQAPPGPMAPTQPSDSRAPAGNVQPQAQRPAVQPRTSIFGAWKFNPDDSDDPRKRLQQARAGGGGGNRRMGGGYPGGGGGYGGRRMGSQGESDEQRQRMQELFSPSRGLTLAEAKKDAEVDLFDDQERKRAFFLDGRKLQKSKDLNYQEIAAHWEGARLVTDEKNPRGGKMSRTYELSYDGTQLYETLHTTVGRNNTPLVLRYVYDQAAGSAAARVPPLTAPAQPAAAPTHRQ
jgi:hypothetical protein